jgi:hypothetical protein
VALVVLLAYFWQGLWAAAAVILARLAAGAVGLAIELRRARRYKPLIGHPLTGAEISFISAYRLHAQSLGRSLDIDIVDDTERAHGTDSLERFTTDWPEVARRFF